MPRLTVGCGEYDTTVCHVCGSESDSEVPLKFLMFALSFIGGVPRHSHVLGPLELFRGECCAPYHVRGRAMR